MSSQDLRKLDRCGCCEAGGPATPERIWNRPSLSAIYYRIGTFGTFRQAMLRAIAEWADLRDWTSRSSDDYGIALLEMWAYIGDILTFYQERTANEAFLATARRRDSVLRLAALLDYKLGPGSAAVAYLAFTTEKDKTVSIPVGLRVQSVPGQDEKPQKFEVLDSLIALPRLNLLKIFPRPQPFNPFAQGGSSGTLTSSPGSLAPGDKLFVFDARRAEVKRLVRVSDEFGWPRVDWEPAVQANRLQLFTTRMAPIRRMFRPFGHNAPSKYLEPVADGTEKIKWTQKTAGTDFDFGLLTPSAPWSIALDGRYEDLKPGTSLVFVQVGSTDGAPDGFARTGLLTDVSSGANQLGQLEDTVTEVTLDFRISGGPSIITDKSGHLRIFAVGDDGALWSKTQNGPGGWGGWVSLGGQIDLLAVGSNQDGRLEVFARGADQALWHIWQIAPNDGWSGWRSLGGQIDLLTVGSNADGRLEVFARGMDKALWHIWQVAPNDGWSGWRSLGVPMWPIDDRRKVLVYEQHNKVLVFWNRRFSDKIAAGADSVFLPLERLDQVKAGRTLILHDRQADPHTASVVSTTKVDSDADGRNDHWQIVFTPKLPQDLKTATAVAYGNVTKASHGETVSGEILGDGKAAADFQKLELKKSPVTHVPDAKAPKGAASTLKVRVDGVLWQEKRSFYGQKADAQIYTSRIADDGTMTVQFGNGENGSRLLTGRGNVTADYRVQLGLQGRVRSGSLTTLLDRPVGLKSATNPAAAQGGSDPETLATARRNAPNTVRTFNRVISLQDFEDAAREYQGVTKARAAWAWEGEERIVRLTVAADGGAILGDSALEDLVDYLDDRRDRFRQLRIENYQEASLRIEALITVDPAYVAATVVKAARKALLDSLDFDRVDLGQPVHLSDVYALLQDVDGVVAVDLDILMFKQPTGVTTTRFYQDLRRRSVHFSGPGPTGPPKDVQPRLLLFPNELARLEDAATDLRVEEATS